MRRGGRWTGSSFAAGRGAGVLRALRSAVRSGAPLLLALTVPSAEGLGAQAAPDTAVLRVPAGNSTVVTYPRNLGRVSVGDPSVADAVVVSAREVVVNGKAIGTTTLLAWTEAGGRRQHTVRVTPDVASLEADLRTFFPEEEIGVAASAGNTVVLSGTVSDPAVAGKAVGLAGRLGEDVNVLNNLKVPDPAQVLLQVRFAEVNRTALREYGARFLRLNPVDPLEEDQAAVTPESFSGAFPGNPTQSFSEAVNFFLFERGTKVSAFIRALEQEGHFRSLAEPNLLTVPGDSASFLAGGEFPIPVVQAGAQAGGITVQFREFGIRLNFFPTITNSGAVRMRVAPEVSQLDFANALEVEGFRIPAISARRAETVVELREGQTFAIAGLLDSSLTRNVNKVPLLGDIPILGSLFRSKQIRQNRTELLVLVTPYLVQPTEAPPALPTGEPETWRWDESIPDTLAVPAHPHGEGAGR